MEIELKRISFNPRIDGQSFAANLMIDGVKAGSIVSNRSGSQYYPVNEKGQVLIEKAEKYCEKLPTKTTVVNGKEQDVKQSLSSFIGDLFAVHLETLEKVKFNKKVDAAMKQNIVIGEPTKYIRTIPTKSPINLLAQSKGGQDLLLEMIVQRAISGLSSNEKILNTNIPESILKASGLKEAQFIKQETTQEQKQQQSKPKGNRIS